MIRLLTLFALVLFTAFTSNAQKVKGYEIYTSKGKKVSYEKMIKSLKTGEFVFFGEYHDNPISHWLQLEVLEDLHEAEVIVIMGQNPGTNHPRMLTALEKCKKNGGKIISVNPIPEAGSNVFVDPQNPFSILKGGTQLSDQYIQVKINGDVALLKAVMLLMLEAEEKNPGTVFDHDFIKEHCIDYEAFIADLKTNDLHEAIAESGVSEEEVRLMADLMIQKKKIHFCMQLKHWIVLRKKLTGL